MQKLQYSINIILNIIFFNINKILSTIIIKIMRLLLYIINNNKNNTIFIIFFGVYEGKYRRTYILAFGTNHLETFY